MIWGFFSRKCEFVSDIMSGNVRSILSENVCHCD